MNTINKFLPSTGWGWFVLVMNALCIVMCMPPVIFIFNKPEIVLGLPKLYVWCTSWYVVWIISNIIFVFKSEKEWGIK